MSPIPPITLAQCQANNTGVAPGAGVQASDKLATSPGISGQTAPPAPVVPSSQKILSPEQLEAAARKSVSEFIKEKYKPRGDKDERLISTLKASAKCFAEQNWLLQKQLSPNNAQRLSDAERLWRQAHETRQGLAETREDIVGEKIAELIRVDLVLEHRLKNHPSKPLTAQEKQALLDLTKETDDAVWENIKAWVSTKGLSESFYDLGKCEKGLTNASANRELANRIAEHAQMLIQQLDRATP